MKAYKKILAALAALILCFSAQAPAFAADAAPSPESESEISFEGKSWDDVVDELLEQFNTTRYSISAGYLNLASGEEHYVNGDNYNTAGVLYLLPMNMYLADTNNGGIESWTANNPGVDFAALRKDTLSYSADASAVNLTELLGGYNEFRSKTAEYMGTSADALDPTLFADNQYSAKEFINCLKLLYTESARFPGIVEAMAQTDAGEAKLSHKQSSFELGTTGTKLGAVCGIAHTAEPIALVMFTKDVEDADGLMAAYCSAMADYTEYALSAPAETEAPSETEKPSVTVIEPEVNEEAAKPFPFVATIAVLLFVVVALVLVIRLSIKHDIKVFWLLLAIIISAAAMSLSIIGMHMGTVYAKPSGDPAQTADEFLSSLCAGNYDKSYSYLRDYADLGLANLPETKAGQLVYEALHQSFSYELKGECSVDMLEASQPLTFSYLDITRLESAVVEETPKQLRMLVSARPMNEIYDANRNFLPEVTEEAYIKAIETVLENSAAYYSSIELNLQLSYSGGRWQVLASPALLRALNGGAGY